MPHILYSLEYATFVIGTTRREDATSTRAAWLQSIRQQRDFAAAERKAKEDEWVLKSAAYEEIIRELEETARHYEELWSSVWADVPVDEDMLIEEAVEENSHTIQELQDGRPITFGALHPTFFKTSSRTCRNVVQGQHFQHLL